VLAATPDRLATFDGEKVVLEVKCLSASREFTPFAAVTERQKQSSFGFCLKVGEIILKIKHRFFLSGADADGTHLHTNMLFNYFHKFTIQCSNIKCKI
jgi:hypothetical protein